MDRPLNEIVCLGAYGGIDSSNLSSWLLRIDGTDYLFDAGSPLNGMCKYKELSGASIDVKGIDSIFISHAHLDHTAGLYIMSPQLPAYYFGAAPRTEPYHIVGFRKVADAVKGVFDQSLWPNIFITGSKKVSEFGVVGMENCR